MTAHRSRQDLAAKEAEKAAAQAGMAAHRSNQDLAAKEKENAADKARKAAQRERQDLAARTSSFKRKSSEPITRIPNKMAAVQEQEE